MKAQLEKDVLRTLQLGMTYANKEGIYTYDVNDIKGLDFIVKTYRSKFGTLLRYAILGIELFFPKTFRKLFKVEKMVTAGGVGIFLNANCNYYSITKNKSDLDNASELVNWLKENEINSKNGIGWGFPFDWQSIAFVPKNSPIGHTTMCCVNGLLNYYRITQDEQVKTMIIKSCEFFMKDLHLTVRDNGAYALSYTTYDKSQVINTNADIAVQLMLVGKAFNRTEYVAFAKKIFLFVTENQNKDGSWGYYANDSVVTATNSIDNYHTGMILSALNEAVKICDDSTLKADYMQILEKGVEFYLTNLFDREGGSPHLTPTNHYPVDSYSCGQSIFTLGNLELNTKKIQVESDKKLTQVLQFLMDKMQNNDGSFVTKKYKMVNYNIGSLRWSQAMICLGLSEIALKKSTDFEK